MEPYVGNGKTKIDYESEKEQLSTPLTPATLTISTPATVDLTSSSDFSSSTDSKTEPFIRPRRVFLKPKDKKSVRKQIQFNDIENLDVLGHASNHDDLSSSDSSWFWKDTSITECTQKFQIESLVPSPLDFTGSSLSSNGSGSSYSQDYSDTDNHFIDRKKELKYGHLQNKLKTQTSFNLLKRNITLLRMIVFLISLHTCLSILLVLRLESIPQPSYKVARNSFLGSKSQIQRRDSWHGFRPVQQHARRDDRQIVFKSWGGKSFFHDAYGTMHESSTREDKQYRYLIIESLDVNMYKSMSDETTQSLLHPRLMLLGDESVRSGRPPVRYVDIDKTPFTDNTQLYGLRDSGDVALSKMEVITRDNFEDSECVAESWQSAYEPACNSFHELDMSNVEDDKNGGNLTLSPKAGYWRNAWNVEFPFPFDSALLKTPKYMHNFEAKFYETDRIDALAMSRLTFSPHVIKIYSFCARSVITEMATGMRLGTLADKSRRQPLQRLKIATDLAQGLVDVHYGRSAHEVEFVHMDLNPNNVVVSGNRLKINDFNIGMMLKRNKTSGSRCTFPTPAYPNAQWRSPEEVRNSSELTAKVDVFSLGHIFYRILVGHEPWGSLEPGGKPSRTKLTENVKDGKLPFIPSSLRKSHDPEIETIYTAMMMCYTVNATERPSSKEIAGYLQGRLNFLQNER